MQHTEQASLALRQQASAAHKALINARARPLSPDPGQAKQQLDQIEKLVLTVSDLSSKVNAAVDVAKKALKEYNSAAASAAAPAVAPAAPSAPSRNTAAAAKSTNPAQPGQLAKLRAAATAARANADEIVARATAARMELNATKATAVPKDARLAQQHRDLIKNLEILAKHHSDNASRAGGEAKLAQDKYNAAVAKERPLQNAKPKASSKGPEDDASSHATAAAARNELLLRYQELLREARTLQVAASEATKTANAAQRALASNSNAGGAQQQRDHVNALKAAGRSACSRASMATNLADIALRNYEAFGRPLAVQQAAAARPAPNTRPAAAARRAEQRVRRHEEDQNYSDDEDSDRSDDDDSDDGGGGGGGDDDDDDYPDDAPNAPRMNVAWEFYSTTLPHYDCACQPCVNNNCRCRARRCIDGVRCPCADVPEWYNDLVESDPNILLRVRRLLRRAHIKLDERNFNKLKKKQEESGEPLLPETARAKKPYWDETTEITPAFRTQPTEPSVIFAAFKHVPLHKVRVVVLGQDPMTREGGANGYPFCSATDDINDAHNTVVNVLHEMHNCTNNGVTEVLS